MTRGPRSLKTPSADKHCKSGVLNQREVGPSAEVVAPTFAAGSGPHKLYPHVRVVLLITAGFESLRTHQEHESDSLMGLNQAHVLQGGGPKGVDARQDV